MKIGIIGTSRYNLVDKNKVNDLIQQSYNDLIDKIDKSTDLEIVYGGGVVPMTWFEFAKNKGIKTTQIINPKVKNQPNESKTIVIGNTYGDESSYFLNYIDGLIKIGGGPQSESEKKSFLEIKKDCLFMEYELPLKK